MTTKKRKYKCKTDGYVGHAIINGKRVAGLCARIRMDGTCGAHGNTKCVNKEPNQ